MSDSSCAIPPAVACSDPRRQAAPELLPVRSLAQLTYCHRLYWFQYAEAQCPVNEYLEDGLRQHQRVNSPELEFRRRREHQVLHSRSVALGSAALGLTARLDVIEETPQRVIPVEYKRAAAWVAPDGQPQVRDSDAIQVAAQAMLLEEHLGHPVPRAVVYYMGSKTRVGLPVTEALRDAVRQAAMLARELSARQTPPPPLPSDQRHKCIGCSLIGICQPEETLALTALANPPASVSVSTPSRAAPQPSPQAIPRVLPTSHDGAVLYVQEPGTQVGLRGESLVVRTLGQDKNRIPLTNLHQVVIYGGAVQVTTQAITALAEREIPLMFLSGAGRFVASVTTAPAKNANLRAAQYRAFDDPARALTLARAVVRAKIANQRTLLMRSLRAGLTSRRWAPTDPPPPGDNDTHAETTQTLRTRDDPAIRAMADMLDAAANAPTVEVLLGLEGQAAAAYFASFGRMLKPQPPGRGFEFHTRTRRPPADPVNAVLSFAYALATKDCYAALLTVGFDPYWGFLHTARHGRPSLALDLLEEFRAVLADSVTLSLFNNERLSPEDFQNWGPAWQLSATGRARLFAAYQQRLADEIVHPVFGYRMSWSRMIEVQARMLASHLRGEWPQYMGLTVR